MAKIMILNVKIRHIDTVTDELLFLCSKTIQECSYNLMKELSFQKNSKISLKNQPKAHYCPTHVNGNYIKNLNVKDISSPKICIKLKSGQTDFLGLDHYEEIYITYCSELMCSSKNKVIVNMNGYAVSTFVQCLTNSHIYLELVANNISAFLWNYYCIKISILELLINLQEPEQHVMDLTW